MKTPFPNFGPCENLLRLLHLPTAAVAREVTISLPHPEDLEVVGIASRPLGSSDDSWHSSKGSGVLILGGIPGAKQYAEILRVKSLKMFLCFIHFHILQCLITSKWVI